MVNGNMSHWLVHGHKKLDNWRRSCSATLQFEINMSGNVLKSKVNQIGKRSQNMQIQFGEKEIAKLVADESLFLQQRLNLHTRNSLMEKREHSCGRNQAKREGLESGAHRQSSHSTLLSLFSRIVNPNKTWNCELPTKQRPAKIMEN
jgi:hypothetical protein